MPRYTFVDFLPRWLVIRGVSIGALLLDAAQQGCCARAYMDVFTAIQQQGTNGRDVMFLGPQGNKGKVGAIVADYPEDARKEQ